MPVTRSSDNPAKPMDSSHFNGAARAQDLGAYEAPNGSVLLVSFPAGVHSNWHRHTEGQFLYITDGSGRVGTRDGAVESLTVGDLVHAAPGEEHWHGASEEEAVSHLAVSLGTTEWLEEVDE
jgi:quercetin dioxygenase-like cupin family protein